MTDLEQTGDVFVLHMREGENRFNDDSIASLNACLDEVEAFDGPAALVTVGEGRFYSNGLDLDWMGGLESTVLPGFISSVLGLFARILEFPGATVAAMNGHAFAGGGMLALAHDYRIMRADRGFFCLPEVDLQMPLHPGMTALIAARLDRQTAHEAITSGRRYGGEECARAGIAQIATSETEVLPRAIELAQSLAGKPRGPMQSLKRGLYPDVLAALRGDPALPS